MKVKRHTVLSPLYCIILEPIPGAILIKFIDCGRIRGVRDGSKCLQKSGEIYVAS